MRIAIIGHKRIPSNEGGIEKGVEQHAVRMVALGHEVDVYNRGGADKYSKRRTERLKEYKGVRIITVPTFQNPKLNAFVYSLLATLRAAFGRYDVVSYRASGPCAMIGLARLLGMRCVASLHGIDSKRDKWGGFASRYLRFGEKTAATKADAVMVLSRNMRDYVRHEYGREAILFYNGVDEPELLPAREIRERFGLRRVPTSYISPESFPRRPFMSSLRRSGAFGRINASWSQAARMTLRISGASRRWLPGMIAFRSLAT